MAEPTVFLTRRGEERLHAGHPWIYRSDIAEARAAAGDVVRLVGPRGRVWGRAMYSDRSQIALRALAHEDEPVTEAFWRARIAAAIELRRSFGIDATAYRVIHGEGDRLPSLIVDRYGDYLVVQTLSQGMARLEDMLIGILADLLAPAGVLVRNDPRVRLLEGLPQEVRIARGEIPPTIVIREGASKFGVDLRAGQKTGFFLDQRENRDAAAGYARGRLLDCFSYTGAFAVRLAPRCDSVRAVDVSSDAVARIAENAARNECSNIEAIEANVFELLRGLEAAGERFDTIVLDPPAFAKNKAAVPKAIGGYKELNLRAIKLLAPGGHLITSSCSYNVNEDLFTAIVTEAAIDAAATLALVEKRVQSRDHPVLVGVPETSYLKCLILRKVA